MIAVLGALQAEVYQMKRRITGVESCWWAGREMSQGDLGPRRVLCTWTGAGIAQAAITAQHICSRYKPEIILFGGIGGALNPIYELGDIVIAEDVIQWDIDTAAIGGGIGAFPGRQNDSRWVRELPADPALRKRLEQHCAGHAGKVYKGRFLSGDRFIPIKNGAEERGALNKALGGDIADMESSSIALAGKLNNTPVVLLRIVSDTVRAERPANFRKFIDRASETIADIFESFIKASIRQDPR